MPPVEFAYSHQVLGGVPVIFTMAPSIPFARGTESHSTAIPKGSILLLPLLKPFLSTNSQNSKVQVWPFLHGAIQQLSSPAAFAGSLPPTP